MRYTLTLLLLASLAFTQEPADKTKADQLRKEIAELKAKLASKEQELSKLAPPVKLGFLNYDTLTIGLAGELGAPKEGVVLIVDSIIDQNELLAKAFFIGYQMKLILRIPTKGLVDGKNLGETLSSRKWKVVDTKKIFGSTHFVLEPYDAAPLPPAEPIPAIKTPQEAPKLPDLDPNDSRPLLVRQWAAASKLNREFAKIPDVANLMKLPEYRQMNQAMGLWKAHEQDLLARIKQTRTDLEKEAKAKTIKQAEDMWPIPKGTPTLQRAKIEAKQTAWVNEHLKPLLEKIAKEYSLD